MKREQISASIFALFALAVTGCAGTNRPGGIDLARIPNRIVSSLSKPITDFAEGDAKTTIAWVDQEEEAGRLSAEQAKEARMCPSALLALSETLKRVRQPAEFPGDKGAIFYATIAKYAAGGAVEEKLRMAAIVTMAACQHLVPAQAFAPAR